MQNKYKTYSKLEICPKCLEKSNLEGNKICYWCKVEMDSKGQDVYDLPADYRVSLEGLED